MAGYGGNPDTNDVNAGVGSNSNSNSNGNGNNTNNTNDLANDSRIAWDATTEWYLLFVHD